MKPLYTYLLVMLWSIAVTAQKKSDPKIIGKAKFLMTEVNFNNLPANKPYVGLIMFINVSKEPLTILEINNECSCFTASPREKVIYPNEKGIITYKVDNPPKGSLRKKSFIRFKEMKEPVGIVIRGSFI